MAGIDKRWGVLRMQMEKGGQEAVSLPKAFGPLSPQAGVARQRLSREEPDA